MKPLQLGELEIVILNLLWQHEELDAKAVCEYVGGQRDITLSTVQSTIERLCKKNLVSRKKVSHAFRYRALIARERLIGQLIGGVITQVSRNHAAPALSCFLDMAEEIHDDALAELERMIQQRREERAIESTAASDRNEHSRGDA